MEIISTENPVLVSEMVNDFTPNEDNKPKKIRLITDDYHLDGFGRLDDGSFFLLSSQLSYDHEIGKSTDYMCKFCFNRHGDLVDHTIIKLGVRGEFDDEEGAKKIYSSLLPEEGTYGPADCFIKPFSVDFDGKKFGFLIGTPEDEEDLWTVKFMPGNTMAFFEPWDSGDYDT